MVAMKVGALFHKPQGFREIREIDESMEFEASDNIRLRKNVKGGVQFLKLPHEINVQIKNLETTVSCCCSRCLQTFLYNISIPFAEREFIIDLPLQSLETGEDVFYIRDDTIVLDDMIREELLLHFPFIPLCSESCKGLCNQCGQNLNEKDCEHQ